MASRGAIIEAQPAIAAGFGRDPGMSDGMLVELSGAGSAAHAQVLERGADPGLDMPGDVGQAEQSVRIQERAADLRRCDPAVLPLPFMLVAADQTVGDDDRDVDDIRRKPWLQARRMCSTEFERWPDIERVGIRQERPRAFSSGSRKIEVAEPVRLDVAGVVFLAEMDLQGDEIFFFELVVEVRSGDKPPRAFRERTPAPSSAAAGMKKTLLFMVLESGSPQTASSDTSPRSGSFAARTPAPGVNRMAELGQRLFHGFDGEEDLVASSGCPCGPSRKTLPAVSAKPARDDDAVPAERRSGRPRRRRRPDIRDGKRVGEKSRFGERAKSQRCERRPERPGRSSGVARTGPACPSSSIISRRFGEGPDLVDAGRREIFRSDPS